MHPTSTSSAQAPSPQDPLDRGRFLFLIASLCAVFLIIGSSLLASASESKEDGEDSLNKYMSVFTEVLSLVDNVYVDETAPDHLIEGAFEGAMEALGPFAVYIPEGEMESFETVRTVGGARSGLTLLKDQGVLWVLAVAEGSPAEDAGMKNGDIISKIGDDMTREMSMLGVLSTFAQDLGTEVKVEVIRSGRRFRISFQLAEFPPPGVVLEAHRGVPVLRIASFHQEAVSSVYQSLAGLEGEAGRFLDLSVEGEMVLDLRGVAGGEESAAYEIAGYFTQGKLGSLLSRDEVVTEYAEEEEPAWQGNFTILVDRSTQGPAEILATILKQNHEARIVGERSYGYSGRLEVLALPSGGGVQLTDAYFTGPDLVPLRESLEPDIWARNLPAGTGEEEEESTTEETATEGNTDAESAPASEDTEEDTEEDSEENSEENSEEDDPTMDNVLERALDAILEPDDEDEEAAVAA